MQANTHPESALRMEAEAIKQEMADRAARSSNGTEMMHGIK